jgi:hypothetical protein
MPLFDYDVDSKDCYEVDFCCLSIVRRDFSTKTLNYQRKKKKVGSPADKSYPLWEMVKFSDATHIGLSKGQIF